jgi:2-hydroxychromene-2-carboxylate isomerase
MQDARIKSRLIRANEAAICNGVFGSPFFLVAGEPFGERPDHFSCAADFFTSPQIQA